MVGSQGNSSQLNPNYDNQVLASRLYIECLNRVLRKYDKIADEDWKEAMSHLDYNLVYIEYINKITDMFISLLSVVTLTEAESKEVYLRYRTVMNLHIANGDRV